MPLRLPPKHAEATPDNVRRLQDGLTSVVAGHPLAQTTYTFYEELDAYLGPWGSAGYPIGYGKLYNLAFTTNEKLQADPVTREWVWRTTITLQEHLRDFVVGRFRQGTLATLTEPELRRAAFQSHPTAYTESGLALVATVAPELTVLIVLIAGAEFSPFSPNFAATIAQATETAGLVLPQVLGMGLAAMAGPAHTGLFARAARRDLNRQLQEANLSRELTEARRAVLSGRFDRIAWLNRLTDRLNSTQFPDQGFAEAARQIVILADARKRRIANTYRALIRERPDLESRFNEHEPGWQYW